MRRLAKRGIDSGFAQKSRYDIVIPSRGYNHKKVTEDELNKKNVIGDGNYGYRVVVDFVFGDEHQWSEDIVAEWICTLRSLVGNTESLYVIANAFNLCVILIAHIGSTTVLPLYSYSDRPSGTLVIGLLTDQQHFIQTGTRGFLEPCSN
ncbi:hypothetical protein M9H77_21636 [Catharanthus roseus]|uniref:Uncharacterized protein n=1 Tax=Catharanthus roseus TaxID=4058 RepID=A0ACC0AQU3_CATRO|nr:hypothetical protein M9H77_21636 [Catharanthus roseus]